MNDTRLWLLLCTLLFVAPTVKSDSLKPFTTDGCSMFPDGTYHQQSLWLNCCIQHDLAYWKGGTEQQRLAADQSLEQCVSQVGEPEIAKLMLAGVRVGGSPYFPTSYRWGYGWSYQRGYKPLSDEEKQQVAAELRRLRMILQGLEQVLASPSQ
ncbi:MAG: hypothetical protein P8171_16750 [Candidatus Thiodiazotropha sp.]